MTVGDATFGPFAVRDGSMGLAFENCRGTFSDVEIEPGAVVDIGATRGSVTAF